MSTSLLPTTTTSTKLMCNKVNIKKFTHRTGNGLKKQATTVNNYWLHSSHPRYQDFTGQHAGALFVHPQKTLQVKFI